MVQGKIIAGVIALGNHILNGGEDGNMKKNEKIRCERCGEILNPSKAKWLELSQTDGNYYTTLPKNHISQGAFSFGTACATTQIKETLQNVTDATNNRQVFQG